MTAASRRGVAGPIGLGFRVPLLVVSPFSRGGYVCSDTFDHTSQLRFIETRFGVKAPNISAWRRSVTGDLTSTLHVASTDVSVPSCRDLGQRRCQGKEGVHAVTADRVGCVEPRALPGPDQPDRADPGGAGPVPSDGAAHLVTCPEQL